MRRLAGSTRPVLGAP